MTDSRHITADESADSVSLGARLRQPKTWLSFLLPLVLVAFAVMQIPELEIADIAETMTTIELLPYLAAAAVFYLTLPMRGYRWVHLLAAAGIRTSTLRSTHIIFTSWVINCLVPAKLGDLYRVVQARREIGGDKATIFGTLVAERSVDLLTMAVLAIGGGMLIAHSSGNETLGTLMLVTGGLFVVLLTGLLIVHRALNPILRRLGVPAPLRAIVERVIDGLFAIGPREIGPVLGITVANWMLEGARLALVLVALGVPGVGDNLPAVLFVALIAAVLTAVPLTPGGLGVVEAGMSGLLVLFFGLPIHVAASAALLDRVTSTLSLVAFGALGAGIGAVRRLIAARRAGPAPRIRPARSEAE